MGGSLQTTVVRLPATPVLCAVTSRAARSLRPWPFQPLALVGLQEIAMGASTVNSQILDPLVDNISSILKDTFVRAVDGLPFASRDAMYVHLRYFRISVSMRYPAYLIGMQASRQLSTGKFVLSAAFHLGAAHIRVSRASIRSYSTLHITLSHPS